MEFLFECSTRYLTSKHSERTRYRVEHQKKNSISRTNHVLFCLLYKHLSDKKKSLIRLRTENGKRVNISERD